MKNSMNNYSSKLLIKNNNSNIRNKYSKYQKKITFQLIYDLYKSNFIDNCELIILEKQNIFLDKFFNKMTYIIKGEFSDDIFEKNKSLYEITKRCENNFIKEVYWPMYNACSTTYEKFQKNKNNKNNNKINYVTNFSSHCNYEQIALHTCGSKMLEINPENPYIICSGCKKCYYDKCVLGYCPFSMKQYFFKKINKKNEKNFLEPATWEEYHCKNPVINEQMSCVKCGELFFLKNNKILFCKKCKLEVDPLMILWTCKICKQEFKSEAKKYNPLEFKEEENAIKEAFLYKIIVKPNELPCRCFKNIDLKNTNFYHNKKCKGLLYFGKLRKNEIVVCSECKCFYDIKKFLWCCPLCKKNFGCKNICLNPKYEEFHFFSKNKNDKKNKEILLKEKNKNQIFLNFDFNNTPIRDQRFNLLSIGNNNIKSYIKKKPEDFYNYTNRNRDSEENGLSRSNNKHEKRNLSLVFKNKYFHKNSDILINNELNSTEIKDNINNKFSQTNINFYKTQINSSKTDIKNRENNNSNSFITVSNSNNNYLKTEKIQDNKFSKINFISNISPPLKKISRYSSISSRNYNGEENDENLISDFNRFNQQGENRHQKLSNYQIYIPKRKFDLNKSSLNISLSNNNNFEKNNKNIEESGYKNKKMNTSNSVGIREKYKKIKLNNKDITNNNSNNLDNNRNIQTIFVSNKEKEKENYSFLKTQKDFYPNNIIVKEEYNNKINKEMIFNNIRSSSQIRIERKENYLKNKYNKRNIISKYNFMNDNNSKKDYSNELINNNLNNNNINNNNIYQRITTNNLDNKNNKDLSTTNRSNGADSFILQNQVNKDINNNNILNVNEDSNNNNSNNNINNTRDTELKEFNFNDYKIITQLGQGTFGKIYLVQDKNNQLFSMKKIILSEELDVQSVISEYKMCQKLSHENIVQILGIYTKKLDATTYVVYVLMEVGLTDWEKQIMSYADKKIEYTEKNLISIIKQLTTVLAFLQKNNTSHRDIKPQNILVFKNGIYKLADFGEAKQIDTMKNLIVNYSLRGTELYMSPLLFNGLRNGQIDIKHNLFKSDVYSLGLCILFAAVRNNKPLYEIRKFIDMKGVKKYLEKILKGKYSSKFINLIGSMLEIHEKNRPDFIELDKIMKKWK